MSSPDPETDVQVPIAGESGQPDLAALAAGDVFLRNAIVLPGGLPPADGFVSANYTLRPGGIDAFQEELKKFRWKMFYIGPPLTVSCFGKPNHETIKELIDRIAFAVDQRSANCFTITGVEAKRKFGFGSVSLSAQPRHLQRGFPVGQIES